MEWHVVDVLALKTPCEYALVLNADVVMTMIAQVKSPIPIHPGDTLYPVLNANYCVNRDRNRLVKARNVIRFCINHWDLLRKESGVRRRRSHLIDAII